MDYLVVKTAFELLSYVRSCLDDKSVSAREYNRLRLLYCMLNDYITTSLEKEKGAFNVSGTEK